MVGKNIKNFMNDNMDEFERNKSHIFRICRREKQVCVMVSYIDFRILQRKFDIFHFLKKCKKKNASQRRRDRLKEKSITYLALVIKNLFKNRERILAVNFLGRIKRIVKVQKRRNESYRAFKDKWSLRKKAVVFEKIYVNFMMGRLRKDQITKGLMMVDLVMEARRKIAYGNFIGKISKGNFYPQIPINDGVNLVKDARGGQGGRQGGSLVKIHTIKNNVSPLVKQY